MFPIAYATHGTLDVYVLVAEPRVTSEGGQELFLVCIAL